MGYPNMFTGLVECAGTVLDFAETAGGRRFRIQAPDYAGALATGESVAVNGCCLTATEFEGDTVVFDLLHETLLRTNLGRLRAGSRVNLERALAANARLGGHFVQGHIDGTTPLVEKESQGTDVGLTFAMPAGSSQYFISKGSVAINGVSLTVSDIGAETFRVWIIPHTLALTNLGDLAIGDAVNLEFDVLAKYVERMWTLRQVATPIPGECL